MGRDEMITSVWPAVQRAVEKLGLPPEADADGIVGAGVEAVVLAADQFDPAVGVPWAAFAMQRANWAILDEVRKATGRKRKSKVESMENVGGLRSPAPGPDQIAEAFEMLTTRSVTRIAETLPSPDAVAERVTRLREAMYARIGEADVGEVMDAVLAKAKAGNVGAAKLVFEMLSPSRGGTKVVQQQAVIISPGDIG